MAGIKKEETLRGVMYALVFFTRKLAVIIAAAAVLLMVLIMSISYSNIYMIISGGLDERSDVTLLKRQPTELTKFFTSEFIASDATLTNQKYNDYAITSYYQTVSLESLIPWPWQDTVTATIVHRMTRITGDLRSDKKTEEQIRDKVQIPPPAWLDGRYRVTMKRVDGFWRVDRMELIEVLPKIPARPTPDITFAVSPSPSPSGSPLPSPTPSPDGSPTASPTPS